MNKKIGFISLGCAKNLTDTESMMGILKEDGFLITADADDADIIIVNTCAFIDSAKEESINTIIDTAKYKNGKCELLVVTGCLAQRYKSEIESELAEVDIILGTNDYPSIAEAIKKYYASGEKQHTVSAANNHVSADMPRVQSTPFYTAYLKIADGCDNFCTYCIIPKLRGKFKSRSKKSIIDEAKALAKNGVKELILVAQDTAYYGKDLNDGYYINSLLHDLSRIDGIEWIRMQYCYPENITDGLIDEVAANKKAVKYFDMPLQHVSDNVLKRMGRKSRYKDICTLIDKIRKKIDGVSLRTSLIAGFPGETDEDFEILKNFLAKYRLDKVGVFAYSREEDTPAYSFDNQIADDIKIKRRDELMRLQKEISKEINALKVGKTADVIIEDYDGGELCYVGRCSTDTPEVDGTAYVYSDTELNLGDIVKIKILQADEYDVTGERI